MIFEMSFRDVEKTEAIENLIREKAAKLNQVCGSLMSCRVAVERPQEFQRTGNPFRVRINLTVPGHEFAVTRKATGGNMHDPLSKTVRDAFNAARRKLREHARKRQGEVKTHPEQEKVGFVVKLFREEGYGFLKTPDGREIYFHRNSVLQDDFDRIEIGTALRYVAEMGEKGLQASTVQIVDKPGVRAGKGEAPPVEAPAGWR